MAFKNSVAIVALCSTLWAVVATSTLKTTFSSGTYNIISDCEQPPVESQVTVKNYQITEPAGMAFSDFGFPADVVHNGETVSGTVGAVERKCHPTYGDNESETDDWIYACYDDGAAVCTILIQAR